MLLECTLLGSISLCRLKFDSPESDSDSDECSQHETEPDFYDGDTELPVFSRMDHGCPVDTLIKTLLPQSLDEKRVCKVQPLGVQANWLILTLFLSRILKQMILEYGKQLGPSVLTSDSPSVILFGMQVVCHRNQVTTFFWPEGTTFTELTIAFIGS